MIFIILSGDIDHQMYALRCRAQVGKRKTMPSSATIILDLHISPPHLPSRQFHYILIEVLGLKLTSDVARRIHELLDRKLL